MQELEFPEVDAGIDEPDEQDFAFSDVFEEFGGATSDAGVTNRRTSVYNQNAQKESYYACSVYGLTHAINENNAIEASKLDLQVAEKDPLHIFRDVVKANIGFRQGFGWSMQQALKYMREQGFIDGYTLVKKVGSGSIVDMRKAIENGYILYSGSNQIDWRATVSSGKPYVKLGSAYGHIFCITDYRVENGKVYFGIRNSVGPTFGDGGYFYLSEDQVTCLFSVYAIIDKSDRETLLDYKAKKYGIYDKSRPNDSYTRLEMATMLSRASKKPISDIYNATEVNRIPSEPEKLVMMQRAFGIHDVSIKTRRDLAIWCADNFIK